MLLAAPHGLEIFAQPTPKDLLGILLAVLLRKRQVLAPAVSTRLLSSGA